MRVQSRRTSACRTMLMAVGVIIWAMVGVAHTGPGDGDDTGSLGGENIVSGFDAVRGAKVTVTGADGSMSVLSGRDETAPMLPGADEALIGAMPPAGGRDPVYAPSPVAPSVRDGVDDRGPSSPRSPVLIIGGAAMLAGLVWLAVASSRRRRAIRHLNGD